MPVEIIAGLFGCCACLCFLLVLLVEFMAKNIFKKTGKHLAHDIACTLKLSWSENSCFFGLPLALWCFDDMTDEYH